MAAREYTVCVKPGDFVNLSFTAIGLRNLLTMVYGGVFVAFLIWAFIGGPGALLVAITLMISAMAFLHWWLNGRLICLDDEPCAIGMVRRLGASNPLEKAGDDDFTMNLLLAPGPTGFRKDFKEKNRPVPPVSDYQTAFQGRLVSPQPSILAIGRAYVEDEDHVDYITVLHCEIEGSGIHNLLIWAGAVLALLIAALVVQAIPGFGWLATLLVLLAFILIGLGLVTGPFAGPGAPGAGDKTDLGEHLKELAAGDIVIVKGVWVYDSLHHGWNEIHPVRACCIVAKAPKPLEWSAVAWPPGFATAAEVEDRRTRWCPMLDDARECEEGGNRDDPANGWILHPLVDGCSNVIIT